jgi:2-iminobutanoate/2-iminopropanoate deaminase
MTLSTIETNEAPAAIGPYAQAVAAGSILFVSGQLGMDPATGELVGPGFADQARQALTNLLSIVHASGSTSEDVIAVDVFLTDMEDFAAFNEIYTDFFKNHTPARAVVAVKALPKGGCVEIKCIAQTGSH